MMNRMFLLAGGLLNLALGCFKAIMPYLFHWREAMGTSTASMWSTLFAENLAISMLMIFFAYMSIFQWRDLLQTSLGKVLMLAISVLFIYRAGVEFLVYQVGVDGAWWRVILFLAMAITYLVPLITAPRAASILMKTPITS
jgi:hypothetical protein